LGELDEVADHGGKPEGVGCGGGYRGRRARFLRRERGKGREGERALAPRLPFPLSPVLPFSAALLPPEEAAALGLLLAGLGGLRLDLRGSLLRGGLLRGLALGPLALEVLPALLDDGEPPAERVEDAAVEEPVAHHLEHPRLLDEV